MAVTVDVVRPGKAGTANHQRDNSQTENRRGTSLNRMFATR
jgi:hypothetical protein